jgi:REP element-mobilizing transposase RayT
VSRQPRIEFPGALYHVMARGNNRERIVHDDRDAVAFLDSLGATCQRYDWRLFAWCIMPNHYHLVLETVAATLSRGMRRHNSTYAQHFNTRHSRVGHVFQGRFKSLIVAKEQYLLTVLRYVELNPWRAGLVQHPEEWPWSSARISLGILPPPGCCAVQEVWQRFGAPGRESTSRYRVFLYEGMREPATTIPVHSALVIGEEDYAAEVLARRGAVSSREVPRRALSERSSLAAIFESARDTDAAIKDAYNAGFTLRAIAAYLGAHYSTVSAIARRTTPRKRGSVIALRASTKAQTTAHRAAWF